jgi:hypothetical protein
MSNFRFQADCITVMLPSNIQSGMVQQLYTEMYYFDFGIVREDVDVSVLQ